MLVEVRILVTLGERELMTKRAQGLQRTDLIP